MNEYDIENQSLGLEDIGSLSTWWQGLKSKIAARRVTRAQRTLNKYGPTTPINAAIAAGAQPIPTFGPSAAEVFAAPQPPPGFAPSAPTPDYSTPDASGGGGGGFWSNLFGGLATGAGSSLMNTTLPGQQPYNPYYTGYSSGFDTTGLLSNPLVLAGIAFGAYMLLKKKK